ncbi:hypothetical protein J4E82_003472 [Alternaria postmessia]|nr:uncharacterized protein J4E82_003472 [Alternaria postmessia]KAI5377729.1 hypothetical protein J4E82_003472 [Alternaria postmessia]
MNWIYDVGTLVPGDQPVVRSKTLDEWVGKLERVKVTVRSEPSKTFAGRMATDLVERTAKRLVGEKGKGETSMRWKEKDIEDDEGFKKDECKMQTRTHSHYSFSRPSHAEDMLESAGLVTLVSKSSPNLLLDLPLEIRDEIHKYAFGDAARSFVVSTEISAYAFASASTY